MKKIIFLFAILTIISGNGCKKKNLTYKINGTVIDSSLNTPLSNAEITISTTSISNPAEEVKATLTTDANGYFEYELQREKIQNVRISVNKMNYFSDGTLTTLDNLSLDNDNVFNYNVYAKSWVRLHFVSDGTKDLKYYKLTGKNNCEECCPTGEMHMVNAVDSSVICINNGNSPYKIYYEVVGGSNHGEMEVITAPFQTTEILINY
ncbi:carboxypeptidase-like regulatory domain-containing protein [Fluviicola taffensis]|uniref:Carboxypeptidase regulatory-like domain-containing protein n=1 Tax=Fluviicola taffensis (strain DSM 16823 / NCIMB 13979 / RW262) TaxID=755732 RepID=F2IBR3_FLUTR|nr:carboxypeptidase-like regulatory domain-containing protein [Fluviicola taffensis]AEA45389.1 hypothetical protein Fluta_3417 [Fluviicola taffensis DSM 16823]